MNVNVLIHKKIYITFSLIPAQSTPCVITVNFYYFVQHVKQILSAIHYHTFILPFVFLCLQMK